LSVVIPSLNAGAKLSAALAALEPARGLIRDIVVADGGSSDDTQALAERAGARVIAAPRGRGVQLRAGAEAAKGDWLLFLHADTVLEPGWERDAARVMEAGESKAAFFRFALDDVAPAARRLEAIVAWRVRLLALPYGDQGLLISRVLYDAIGGYAPLPLMEDVDIVRRLRARRLVALNARAITSAARYRKGYWRRSLRNAGILTLYFLGVSPACLARLYG
jgi:rSAM/selenodomain-associated transferase 2